MKQILWN